MSKRRSPQRIASEDIAPISATERINLMDTIHLLRSPRNAERLLTALARAQREIVPSQSVEELRREVGLDGLEAPYGPDQEDDGE